MSALLAWLAGVLAVGMPPEPQIEPPSAERPLVVVTYAQLRWTGRAAFVLSSMRLAGKLPSMPGLVANHQGIRRFGAEVWTVSAWQSEQQMLAFVHGPEHGKAMREGAAAVRVLKVHRLRCGAPDVPGDWKPVAALLAGTLPKGCEWAEAPTLSPQPAIGVHSSTSVPSGARR